MSKATNDDAAGLILKFVGGPVVVGELDIVPASVAKIISDVRYEMGTAEARRRRDEWLKRGEKDVNETLMREVLNGTGMRGCTFGDKFFEWHTVPRWFGSGADNILKPSQMNRELLTRLRSGGYQANFSDEWGLWDEEDDDWNEGGNAIELHVSWAK